MKITALAMVMLAACSARAASLAAKETESPGINALVIPLFGDPEGSWLTDNKYMHHHATEVRVVSCKEVSRGSFIIVFAAGDDDVETRVRIAVTPTTNPCEPLVEAVVTRKNEMAPVEEHTADSGTVRFMVSDQPQAGVRAGTPVLVEFSLHWTDSLSGAVDCVHGEFYCTPSR